MNVEKISNNSKLSSYINKYLLSDILGDELEVRFGTNWRNPITKIDFNSVIQKFKSLGFNMKNTQGDYHLNIQNEYTNPKSGEILLSNIRTEIHGLHNIQNYCKTNSFKFEDIPTYITFTQKTAKYDKNMKLPPIDYYDFEFRVNYKSEKKLDGKFAIIQNMLQAWNSSKKTFRLIKRFTFIHDKYPLKIDCSIVKSSKKYPRSNRFIPEFRIETSNIFNNKEEYEVEIELMKESNFPTNKPLKDQNDIMLYYLRKTIKNTLSALQNSNFPISYDEQNIILNDYMKILYKNKPPNRRIRSGDFIGPSSISLEVENIRADNTDLNVPNIRDHYTVTDKADGMRKLLYIHKSGKCYLIDVNMKVQFSGNICDEPKYFGTIIDGEHIIHGKEGKYINIYAAFDIYYLHKDDIRHHPFYNIPMEETKEETSKKKGLYRLEELSKTISNMKIIPFIGKIPPLKINRKTFNYGSGNDIFKKCNIILDKQKKNLFEYEIDGLILTPCNKGVGSNKIGEILEPRKITWKHSMKWKPPEFNTVDFLVTTKKIETGEEFIGTLFEDGSNLSKGTKVLQYKTLVLRVGFDENNDKHGYLNPYEDVIQGREPSPDNDNNDKYKPVPFYPTDPSVDYPAYLCNIIIEKSGETSHLLTEDKQQTFEDRMIVEFRFEKTADKFWQWKPIRVRNKKTAEYRAGKPNFGNAYHVAQSVWRSIHNPVTENMISTGFGIPDEVSNEDKYYDRKGPASFTKSLRNFHNLYVKRKLIDGVSKQGDTLIDQSVGKGGDFPKWIGAKLSFVFGLDLKRDNIENRMDGTYARYLNYRKKYRNMPNALFVRANSSLNIRTGDACFTEKGRMITRAIFGEGSKDMNILGNGVYKQFATGKEGFDIVSNQFSIHYFFENKSTLNNFLRNVSECCKLGGYFIGTSYDGGKIFKNLENKEVGDSMKIIESGQKIWEITKRYEEPRFMNDESCIGYKIDVYQETINKTFSEYLVNYEYLIRLIQNYGFELISKKEANDMNLPSGIGNFSELFIKMENDITSGFIRKGNIKKAMDMKPYEKKISFLNKYFIFKKVRDVNAREVAMTLIGSMNEDVEEETKEVFSELEKKIDRPKAKKLRKKMKLFTVKSKKPEESKKPVEKKREQKDDETNVVNFEKKENKFQQGKNLGKKSEKLNLVDAKEKCLTNDKCKALSYNRKAKSVYFHKGISNIKENSNKDLYIKKNDN